MRDSTMRLRELTVRYSVKKDSDGLPIPIGRLVKHPHEAAAALMRLFHDEAVEVFGVLCLSTKYHVIAYHEVSRGTINTTLVNPREVFQVALLANAASLVVGHSHPSGDPRRALMTRS